MKTTEAVREELPPLPDDDCIVHIFPSDLERMAQNETTATVFSVAVGNPDETSVPLYTADQMRERDAMWTEKLNAALSASQQEGAQPICPTCKGNDSDAPCAYPSEGMAGCLRDKRLSAPSPALPAIDWNKFVAVRPVACTGEPDAHNVIFKVGIQSFVIGCLPCDTKQDAEWFASMLVKALETASRSAAAPDQGGKDKG